MKGSKRAVNPTYAQKKRITDAGLDWKEYLVQEEDNITITLIHKETGKREVVLC